MQPAYEAHNMEKTGALKKNRSPTVFAFTFIVFFF